MQVVHAGGVRRVEAGTNGRKPALVAYAVKDPIGAQQKAIWTRIGAAWLHDNGPGYSIRLDALPLDGRIVLVEPSEPKVIDGARSDAAWRMAIGCIGGPQRAAPLTFVAGCSSWRFSAALCRAP